ncbi:DMT family transporter [Rhizobium rhizophilum]|uniref:DMT family transporter n=2 Tax=Rhizobium rhizophilum TaxID=1850373 RepID=A0ABY2QV06_9HYPH|nr:DMT family transporter [Rhizobium rhizophilum]
MNARDWLMLTVLSVIWGGSFFFTGIAVRELPPFTIVAARVGLAALALLVGLKLAGISMPRAPKIWLAFFGMGLLNNMIPFSLIVWGQGHIASGLASILNATTPLFGVVVAHLLTRDEKMTGGRLAGTIVGFAGVALMIGPSALSGFGSHLIAELAVLGAALSYSFAGVYGRRFKAMGINPIVTATGQISASAVLMIPIALVVEQPWTLAAPGLPTMAALVAIALISTALAYIIFFRILASAGATNLMLVTFLIPVSAILLGWLFLGEVLAPQHFIGMATIVAGLVLIDGHLLRRMFGPSTRGGSLPN